MKIKEQKMKIPDCLHGRFENALFLDIETTGFQRERELIYLIGAAYVKENELVLIQWFCEDGKEEEILKDFLFFSSSFTKLIHYNGMSFDLPFLEEKAKKYGCCTLLFSKEQVDLYREIRPLRKFLNLSDLKLPTVESFFGIEREEEENGKTLILVYKSYLDSPSEEKEELLLKHNYFDLLHLLRLLEIFDLKCCLKEGLSIEETLLTDRYLRVRLHSSYSFLKRIQGEQEGILYSFYGSQGELSIPLYVGSLKYYYKNYKDYSFLTHENMVVHKSIAAFVDSANKEKCTAKNCYVLKDGIFLKQYSPLFEKLFVTEYKGKEQYFESEELKDELKQKEYIQSVIRKITGFF